MHTSQRFRSLLFVPGDRLKFFSKAAEAGADALIFDLEDAVASQVKPEARKNVSAVLRDMPDRFSFVRINHPDLGMLKDDLSVLAPHAAQGVMVPKVERIPEVLAVDALLRDVEEANALPAGAIRMVVLVESALGLRNLFDVLSAVPRVRGAVFASAEEGDFMIAIGGRWTPDGTALAYARGKFVCDARAAGVSCLLDGAFQNLGDEAALARECELARTYGFTGKTAIHPRQVPVMNHAFAPTDAEIARARKLIEAFREAEAKGHGAVQFDGMMVDYANVKLAEQILAAASTAAGEPL